MTLRRSESFGYLVSFLSRLLARALERRVQPLGLHSGQLPALLCLWEREGVSQAELCRLVQVEQPTMANTLNRMERHGLIRREADPADRRRALIFLTERARALEERVVAEAAAVNAVAAGSLSEAERAQLRGLLGRLIANLERDLGN
ncbi:MarR family winged helix-turn-helix transcriptional regulator [Azospirillum sp. ST 5-10]|uniref:MarR family winged helix-turn-helix transcriptional regulator n=1 Tax=unclassified Azospirillum TaxID=2630922 RepID=UPI003F4A509E